MQNECEGQQLVYKKEQTGLLLAYTSISACVAQPEPTELKNGEKTTLSWSSKKEDFVACPGTYVFTAAYFDENNARSLSLNFTIQEPSAVTADFPTPGVDDKLTQKIQSIRYGTTLAAIQFREIPFQTTNFPASWTASNGVEVKILSREGNPACQFIAQIPANTAEFERIRANELVRWMGLPKNETNWAA